MKALTPSRGGENDIVSNGMGWFMGRPPKNDEAMTGLGIRVTPTLKARLEVRANASGLKIGDYVRGLIQAGLEGGNDAVKRLEVMAELQSVQSAFASAMRAAAARASRQEAAINRLRADKKALWVHLMGLTGVAAEQARQKFIDTHGIEDVQEATL